MHIEGHPGFHSSQQHLVIDNMMPMTLFTFSILRIRHRSPVRVTMSTHLQLHSVISFPCHHNLTGTHHLPRMSTITLRLNPSGMRIPQLHAQLMHPTTAVHPDISNMMAQHTTALTMLIDLLQPLVLDIPVSSLVMPKPMLGKLSTPEMPTTTHAPNQTVLRPTTVMPKPMLGKPSTPEIPATTHAPKQTVLRPITLLIIPLRPSTTNPLHVARWPSMVAQWHNHTVNPSLSSLSQLNRRARVFCATSLLACCPKMVYMISL